MIKDGKYIAPTKWEECEREDLNMIPTMIANGFTPDFSSADRRAGRTTPENCPCDGVNFVKGDLHIWKIYNYHKADVIGGMGSMDYEWMTAKLIDGSYSDDKPIKSLKDIL